MGIGQQCWDELALVGDRRSGDRSVKDVILQESSEQSLVGGQSAEGFIASSGEGSVRGRENGDILSAAEGLNERSKAWSRKKTGQAREIG